MIEFYRISQQDYLVLFIRALEISVNIDLFNAHQMSQNVVNYNFRYVVNDNLMI